MNKTDDLLNDIVRRIFHRGELAANPNIGVRDGGPVLAKQAYVRELQSIIKADIAARDAAWIKTVEELIGEDDVLIGDDFILSKDWSELVIRNELRAELRTKLAKMKEKR